MSRLSVEQRREQLVAATIAAISEDGMSGTGMRKIAARAGAPLASVHYAFESRLTLLQATMEALIDQSRRLATGLPVDPAAPPDVAIRLHLRAYLDMVAAHRGREAGLVELMLAALREPALDSLPSSLYQHYYEVAAEAACWISEGLGRSWRLPLRQIARFVVMLTDGLVLGYLATDDEDVTTDLIDAASTALVGLLEPEEKRS